MHEGGGEFMWKWWDISDMFYGCQKIKCTVYFLYSHTTCYQLGVIYIYIYIVGGTIYGIWLDL